MRAVAIGLIIVAALSVIHAALRWMGRRGWIYYGSEPSAPIGARSAMALMEFETLMNPAVEHVLEYRRHGDMWVQESGLGDDDDNVGQVAPVDPGT